MLHVNVTLVFVDLHLNYTTSTKTMNIEKCEYADLRRRSVNRHCTPSTGSPHTASMATICCVSAYQVYDVSNSSRARATIAPIGPPLPGLRTNDNNIWWSVE